MTVFETIDTDDDYTYFREPLEKERIPHKKSLDTMVPVLLEHKQKVNIVKDRAHLCGTILFPFILQAHL